MHVLKCPTLWNTYQAVFGGYCNKLPFMGFLPYFVFHNEFYRVYLYLFMEYLFVRCHVGASQTLPSGPSRVPEELQIN